MADQMEMFFGPMPKSYGTRVTKAQLHSPSNTVLPKNNQLPEGYVALVTGGAVGIGEYIARAYVEAKAAGVIITGRRTGPLETTKAALEKLAGELGHQVKVTYVSGDAEQNETYVKLREHIEKEHGGRLDALIANAGPGNTSPASWTPRIEDQPVEDWNSVLGVNVNGPYYAAKHLIPLLLQAPSQGRTIVNIVSAAAHMTSNPGAPPISYPLAKFAETRLSQYIGEAYAGDDLQAFALHPGGVKTPSSTSIIPEEMQKVLVDSIDLCGSVCVWLSKERPAWLSGRYLSVSWDWDELATRKEEIVREDKFKFRMTV